jgi:hypothetical protein
MAILRKVQFSEPQEESMKDFLKMGTHSALIIVGGCLAIIGSVKDLKWSNYIVQIDPVLKWILVILGLSVIITELMIIIYSTFRIRRKETESYPPEGQKHLVVELVSQIIPTIENISKKEVKPLAEELASHLLPAIIKVINPVVSPTLFGERQNHFLFEKIEIANQFTPVLLKRIKNFIDQGKRVYLLLDSGSTIFNFFKTIGEFARISYSKKKDWLEQLSIETNNLPGVDKIMQVGRINPDSRYSPLAIKVNLLPGTPLPIYSAITGERTVAELKHLRAQAPKDSVFISLVTGNWIRIRRTDPPCPVPLARGEGHVEFKQALIDVSDEVYVIAPLGKIFFDVPPEKVNTALGNTEKNPNLDKRSYHEVSILAESADKVKLVSTSRERDRVLSAHFGGIAALLKYDGSSDPVPESFASMPVKEIPHIFFRFDELPEEWNQEVKTEFPDESTRTEIFMNKYFQVGTRPVTKETT